MKDNVTHEPLTLEEEAARMALSEGQELIDYILGLLKDRRHLRHKLGNQRKELRRLNAAIQQAKFLEVCARKQLSESMAVQGILPAPEFATMHVGKHQNWSEEIGS